MELTLTSYISDNNKTAQTKQGEHNKSVDHDRLQTNHWYLQCINCNAIFAMSN